MWKTEHGRKLGPVTPATTSQLWEMRTKHIHRIHRRQHAFTDDVHQVSCIFGYLHIFIQHQTL